MRTLDGDRTNIVYYSDVHVDDLYRIGEVNGGWTVMRAALDSEHGLVDSEDHGLQNIAAMSGHGMLMAEARGRLRESGFDAAVLWVLRCNERAQRFYEREGWTADGASRLEQPYGIVSDVIRFRRSLH